MGAEPAKWDAPSPWQAVDSHGLFFSRWCTIHCCWSWQSFSFVTFCLQQNMHHDVQVPTPTQQRSHTIAAAVMARSRSNDNGVPGSSIRALLAAALLPALKRITKTGNCKEANGRRSPNNERIRYPPPCLGSWPSFACTAVVRETRCSLYPDNVGFLRRSACIANKTH